MMTQLKKTFFAVYIIAIFLLIVGTQSKVLAQTPPAPTPTTTLSISDTEKERERLLTTELALQIPDATDDPTFPILYTDPSKQGVDITVDDKTTLKAANPFLLPNLSMGSHTLLFKFKNKDGVVRVLTKKLLIIPKAPLFDNTIKTTVVKPASVILSGTALPQATVLIILNSDKTHKVTVSPEGKWEFIIPEPIVGTNAILAFVVREGIISAPSKSLQITYSLTADATTETSQKITASPIISAFNTLVTRIDDNRKSSPILFYGVIAIAVVFILILMLLGSRKKAAKKRDEKTIAALFGTLQKDGGSIVDAIRSVAPKKKGSTNIAEVSEQPKAGPKVKKALDALKEELSDTEESIEEEKHEEIITKKEDAPVESEKTEEKAELPTPVKVETSPSEKVAEPESTDKKVEVVTPADVKIKEESAPVNSGTPKAEKKSLLSFFSKKKDTTDTKPAEANTPKKVAAPKIVEVVEEVDELEEEPEKKVLSKEEFLKQFKKKSDEE